MPKPELEIKTALQVLKPVHDVFEAIIDPSKMSNYFISKGSGRLEDGKEIYWSFPEFDFEFPIRVEKVIVDSYISFFWKVDEFEHLVEIKLTPRKESTVVTITEKKRKNDDAGIKWLKSNTEGWANFLACLKAYMEYGINLRKGAFEFLTDKT